MTKSGPPDTRSRIVDCAVAAFAARPYEAVSLRQIAREVGVDVALVHRTFGSKEALFVAAIDQAFQGPHDKVTAGADLADSFVEALFRPHDDAARERANRLHIILRSFASPTAKAIIKERLERQMLAPLRARMPAPERQRAALMVALMLGSVTMRTALEVDGLDGEDTAEAERLVRAAVAAISGQD